MAKAKGVNQNHAVQDAQAAKLYARLETVAAEVTVERGAKRVAAVDVAANLVEIGYSLRGAAKAAGQTPNNKLQRYFEIAKARLSEGDKAIPVPDGYGTWGDAIAAENLETLTTHIRAVKAGRKGETTPDPDKSVRAYINGALGQLERLVAGEAKSKSVQGYAIGEAQLGRYLKAFVAAGFKIDGPTMDKLTLSALPVNADGKTDAQTIADKVAGMLDMAPPAVLPAAVNA